MGSSDILADKTIKAAIRAAMFAGKAKRINDGGGLYLEARPRGAGWWRLRYWIGSREGMLSLGTYPDVSLKAARDRRNEARKLIAKGINPSDARKAGKTADQASAHVQALTVAGKPVPGTFEAVGREWLAQVHGPKVSAGYSKRSRIQLETDVFP